MAETPSNMLPLNTKAPAFKLPDTRTGEQLSLQELRSDQATVIMFICNHCPYVKLILDKIVEVSEVYQSKGVSFIAINSNDAEKYPADAPNKMHDTATNYHFTFPYLYDETQAVAKAYQAACTPDFYIFDSQLACAYRGRFDDATPGNGQEVTGKDLCTALDQILSGDSVEIEQKPSVGCNIKWKK